jgi:hypothetical protein
MDIRRKITAHELVIGSHVSLLAGGRRALEQARALRAGGAVRPAAAP